MNFKVLGPAKGQILWTSDWKALRPDAGERFTTSPIVGASGEIVWGSISGIRAVDAAGRVLWEFSSPLAESNLLIDAQGRLMFVSRANASKLGAIGTCDGIRGIGDPHPRRLVLVRIASDGSTITLATLPEFENFPLDWARPTYLRESLCGNIYIGAGYGCQIYCYDNNLRLLDCIYSHDGSPHADFAVAERANGDILYAIGEPGLGAVPVGRNQGDPQRVCPPCNYVPTRQSRSPATIENVPGRSRHNYRYQKPFYIPDNAVAGAVPPQMLAEGTLLVGMHKTFLVALDVKIWPLLCDGPSNVDPRHCEKWSIGWPEKLFGSHGFALGQNEEFVIGEYGGYLLKISYDGIVTWAQTVDGVPTVPIIDIDNYCYVGTSSGTVYKIDNKGEVIWGISIGEDMSTAKLAIDSHRHLYVVGRSGRLYCIE